MTARQKREANLGIVLVSISVLFIVCQSVKIIPDVYEVFTCRISSSAPEPAPTTAPGEGISDTVFISVVF